MKSVQASHHISNSSGNCAYTISISSRMTASICRTLCSMKSEDLDGEAGSRPHPQHPHNGQTRLLLPRQHHRSPSSRPKLLHSQQTPSTSSTATPSDSSSPQVSHSPTPAPLTNASSPPPSCPKPNSAQPTTRSTVYLAPDCEGDLYAHPLAYNR